MKDMYGVLFFDKRLSDVGKLSVDGYMTVFLTLIMTVLLSLCLTLIEGARSNAVRMETIVVSNIAVDSIMAEYHRELAKQFNIFAIDDSYGTASASLENTEEHLAGYLNKNFSGSDFFLSYFLYRDYLAIGANKAEIEGVLYMTDEDGKVFRRRAYEALKDDVGLTLLTQIMDSARYIEMGGLETMDVNGQMERLQAQADAGQAAALEENKELPEISEKENIDTNPTRNAVSLTNPMLLFQFVDDVNSLSSLVYDGPDLYSKRRRNGMVNSGNLKLEDEADIEEIVERFVFHEYLLRYFGRYREEGADDALKYQIEYMINGFDSDLDNFVAVVGRILAIRYAEDYLYILSDEEKCEIAEVMATVIAAYTFTEPLTDLYKALILMMWAGMEAQYDTRCILAGSRIELIKTKENWHSTLENSLSGKERDTTGDTTGLSYEDYLRIFLILMNPDQLSQRAMDMVEADIRMTEGNENFRIDACIDTVAVNIETYSKFGYGYKYRIKRKYE